MNTYLMSSQIEEWLFSGFIDHIWVLRHYRVFFERKWVTQKDQHGVVGHCSQPHEGEVSLVVGKSKTYSLGALGNVPGFDEFLEISGTVEWSSETGVTLTKAFSFPAEEGYYFVVYPARLAQGLWHEGFTYSWGGRRMRPGTVWGPPTAISDYRHVVEKLYTDFSYFACKCKCKCQTVIGTS